MWISASGRMWVLGWNTRRLLWSWWRRPRVIKATTNTPLLYISWGQCWITKTCHHETPGLDWFLLPSAVRSNFEIPKPPAIIFFLHFLLDEKVVRRKWSEILSALVPPKNDAMNSTMSALQLGEDSTWFIHLLHLAGGAAATEAQQNTEYVNQRESDTMTGDKKDWRLFPLTRFS